MRPRSHAHLYHVTVVALNGLERNGLERPFHRLNCGGFAVGFNDAVPQLINFSVPSEFKRDLAHHALFRASLGRDTALRFALAPFESSHIWMPRRICSASGMPSRSRIAVRAAFISSEIANVNVFLGVITTRPYKVLCVGSREKS